MRTLYHCFEEPICQEFHLTRTELDILLFLDSNPRYNTAKDIVAMRYLVKSHVSMSLKTLENAGYISKQTSPRDRRTIHLTVTEKAQPVIEAGHTAQNRFLATVLKDIPEEDLQSMHAILDQMQTNIEAYFSEYSPR